MTPGNYSSGVEGRLYTQKEVEEAIQKARREERINLLKLIENRCESYDKRVNNLELVLKDIWKYLQQLKKGGT